MVVLVNFYPQYHFPVAMKYEPKAVYNINEYNSEIKPLGIGK